MPCREQEILILAEKLGCYGLDSSQNILRMRALKQEGEICTVTPGMHLFLFSKNGLVLPWESMNFQAIPWQMNPASFELPGPQIARLAGNAFTGTVSLCVLFGLVSTLSPFVSWLPHDRSARGNLEDELAALIGANDMDTDSAECGHHADTDTDSAEYSHHADFNL